MSVQYHSLNPSNDASDFSEFDSIDFELNVPNRKLLKNSIMFECELKHVFKTGTTSVTVGDRIGLDPRVGYHGLFESWNTSANSVGQIENINSYGRYVASISTATLDEGDFCNVFHQAEGKCLTQDSGCYNVQPIRLRNDTGVNVTVPQDVCVMPKIALNSMAGDDYSFDKNGSIRLSTNLARNNNFLSGGSFADTSYQIQNVRLKFITVPDDGKQGKMLLNSVVSVKSAINSQAVNMVFKVPAKACNGVVINFIQQNRENTNGENSYALENLPNLLSLQMLLNSNTQQGISYEVLDKGEMIKNGIDALSESGHSQASASKIAFNQGFLIGQAFEEYIDLSNQSISINLKHEAPNISTEPRIAYLYFLNLVEV